MNRGFILLDNMSDEDLIVATVRVKPSTINQLSDMGFGHKSYVYAMLMHLRKYDRVKRIKHGAEYVWY